MCAWTGHFLTGSSLAMESGKVALLHLLCSSFQFNRANHRGFLGATLGIETFTDLDYADEVTFLAEMLEVLVLALDILKDEARHLGIEVNWQKTKIQSTTEVTCSLKHPTNIDLGQ